MSSKEIDDAIRAAFDRSGMALEESARAKLTRYCALLETWNRRIRLVGAAEPVVMAERHVLDSFLATIDPAGGETLLDAGTGAGLPGIVVAVVRPDVRVTMIERVAKKVAFVRAAIAELRLTNAEVRRQDLSAIEGRSFDRAISRALMPPATWLAQGARVVRDGGAVGVMVATREEIPPAVAIAGAAPVELSLAVVREITLPSDGAKRVLAWFGVTRST
ncbi:MAG: 16S rRNA (guanine(527)-N(7))-methyltransferase RsmG [Deltaproteobacteria bacterium]|nr:16S rRNA (guanine(527)-N(7))-methyltransferase RsmG [Deltaproteobacteria bacterium]